MLSSSKLVYFFSLQVKLAVATFLSFQITMLGKLITMFGKLIVMFGKLIIMFGKLIDCQLIINPVLINFRTSLASKYNLVKLIS